MCPAKALIGSDHEISTVPLSNPMHTLVLILLHFQAEKITHSPRPSALQIQPPSARWSPSPLGTVTCKVFVPPVQPQPWFVPKCWSSCALCCGTGLTSTSHPKALQSAGRAGAPTPALPSRRICILPHWRLTRRDVGEGTNSENQWQGSW